MSAIRFSLVALLTLAVAAGTGCEKEHFSQPVKLGGKSVSAATLNAGQESYMQYCYACHGPKGNGRGPAAVGLRPPPRNFSLGLFKFGSVPSGQLPTDDDLRRIARNGLHGTAMLAWDIPDIVLDDILQYIKTFSPRWQQEEPGQPIAASPDPYAGKPAAGIEHGKLTYHKMQCWACHPAYATRAEILSFGYKSDFREDMYHSALKDSDYKDPFYGGKILPPDFTRSELRSVRAGSELGDIYRVVGAGIGGAAMPQWKGAIPEEDLWSIAYYIKSLMEMKDTAAVAQLGAKLAAQPAQAPPAP